MSDLLNVTTKAVQELVTRFKANNHAFIFDIFHNGENVFQFVHSCYIEQLNASAEIFGMALNLNFEDDNKKDKLKLERFANNEMAKEFVPYNWDGISCFAKDLKTDNDAAALYIVELFELFGYSGEISFEISDEGEI